MGGGVYLGSGLAIKPIATEFIRQNGFPEAQVSEISLIPSGIMIENISLDGHDFSTVDNITLSLNWMDFLKNRQINSLTIKDISLTAELDELGHLKIAGWDATLPRTKTSSALIPIQTILLQGLTVDLDTPHGSIRLQGKLSLETAIPTQQNIEFTLWGQQHQLSFDAKGSGEISANGEVNFLITLNEGRLNLPKIEMSRASGKINFLKSANSTTPSITGEIVAGKINTLGALLQNVTLNVDTTKPETLSFKTSPAGYKNIQIEGKWVTQPHDFIELTINSLRTLDVIELLYPDKVDDYKSWVGNSNPLALNIKTSISVLQSENKSADFNMSLGKKNSDMSLQANGIVTYHTKNSETDIQFDKTIFHVAGGKITASPVTFNTNSNLETPLALTLSIQSVDMDKMAKLADIEGLAVKGRLSGTLPMTFSNKGIIFGEGLLTSDAEGLFAYKPDQFPQSFQGDDERMQIVRDALSDFKFSKLNFDMSGEFDKKMKTTLTAEGTNPALGDRPIKLNLNLDGDIGAVIKQALQAGGIADKIRSK